MTDSKNTPGPPPDDFSKTVPNVNIPGEVGETGTSSDWDKTNYRFPVQPSAEEWGKTVTNIRPIDTGNPDYGKTVYPGARSAPEVDWGTTQANVRVPDTDFGSSASQPEGAYGKTTPYFQLPEAERQKYQNLPPTPTEQAEQQAREQKEKGGIPGWVWASAGLLAMFMFAVLVLVAVFLFWIYDTNFEAIVRGAPAGSDVFIDDFPWGVTNPDGSIRLLNLRPGTRTIKITHPSFECEQQTVKGGYGVTPDPIIARCREAKVVIKPGENCSNIQLGEEDKAERCYNIALDGLPDPFTADDLVKALNILIINFESGKYDIPPRRLEALRKGAGFIKRLPPSVVLEIGGHTDNVGSDASNLTLSENRANAVKDVLITFGVRPEVLQTRGYGATKPISTNSTELGKFYNRRIAYSVLSK